MGRKLKGKQLIVGNLLRCGRVVFLTANHNWSPVSQEAALAEDEALDKLVAAAEQAMADNIIAGYELAEAETGTAGTNPIHSKPLMQTKGPSVRLDLGYQTGPKWEKS